MSAFDDLIAALTVGPALPGARCRGRHELFDPPEHDEGPPKQRQRQATALPICNACPALDPCKTWLESLPKDRRPQGVVAGLVVNYRGDISTPKCGRLNSRGQPCRMVVTHPGHPCEHHSHQSLGA